MSEPMSPGATLAVLAILWIVMIAVFALPLHRIFKRAGLGAGWIGLTVLPFIGAMALLGILAFQEWPNEPEGYR